MDAGLMITLCLIFAALTVAVTLAAVLLFLLLLELRKSEKPREAVAVDRRLGGLAKIHPLNQRPGA